MVSLQAITLNPLFKTVMPMVFKTDFASDFSVTSAYFNVYAFYQCQCAENFLDFVTHILVMAPLVYLLHRAWPQHDLVISHKTLVRFYLFLNSASSFLFISQLHFFILFKRLTFISFFNV